jgi:hypothetical protein
VPTTSLAADLGGLDIISSSTPASPALELIDDAMMTIDREADDSADDAIMGDIGEWSSFLYIQFTKCFVQSYSSVMVCSVIRTVRFVTLLTGTQQESQMIQTYHPRRRDRLTAALRVSLIVCRIYC